MGRRARKRSRSYTSVLSALLVVAIAGLTVVFFTASPHAAPTTTTSGVASTSVIAPLTGLSTTDTATLQRPVLTVKIENTPDALPQWGIDQADVVYEEIVNGGITRLAALFNSQVPTKIGPVRSVRPTDTQIVWPLGGLFAFSGGAQYAIDSISTAPVKLITETSAGTAMFRDPTRQAPHNLYASGAGLFAIGGGTPVPPPALFDYSTTHFAKGSNLVSRIVVPFPSIYPVTWTWDQATQSYDRTLFGQPDVTGTGVRESPKNVVVMFVNYVNGIGTMNSYADLQSGGPVTIFTKHHVVTGTWSRTSKSAVIQYRTSAGDTIALTPGQTWVELLNQGATLTTSP